MKTILFDLDGTLIDSTEAILESFWYSFRKKNRHLPKEEDIVKLIGYPLDVMYERLGVEKDLCLEYANIYKQYYKNIATKKTQLLPGAKKAVEEASKFARLGVVTTKTASYSEELLDFFYIKNYFKIIIGREHVTHPKPHKEPICKALNLMKIEPNLEVIMIGDTILDLQSANSAQIASIGVLCGYGQKEDLEKFTPNICENALEAVRFLSISKK